MTSARCSRLARSLTGSCFPLSSSRRLPSPALSSSLLNLSSSSAQQKQCFALSTPRNFATSPAEAKMASATSVHEGVDVHGAMEALRTADAVCFDVDSTVITEEGIDVLAEFLGKGAEVAEWTRKAMGGNVKFEDALAARLELIKPSRASIQRCTTLHPFQLSPGIADLIEALQSKGVAVYFVSGGFRVMIDPIAASLRVPLSNVVANTLLFNSDEAGTYAGFDLNEPTSRDGGKPRAVAAIKEKGGYKTVIMVGDGATDAQAKPPANAFVGFGGVVTRDAVRAKADWFVYDFKEMTKIVKSR